MKLTKPNLLLFILLCFNSHGQKYFTLTNGDWNNTANVWSLNGVTPCACFPGNSLITDTLVIDHKINLTAHISASSNSIIQINSKAELSNIMYSLNITGSQVIANGSISIRKLTINAGAKLQVINSTLITNAGIDVYGTLIVDFSNLLNNGGNSETFSTGTVSLINDSRWQINSGNYKNSGITNICSTCCLYLSTGNIQNSIDGSFTGSGAVISSFGSLKNEGTWDSSIVWCSTGSDNGMVTPENCILANDMCLFVPLPTQLNYFVGYRDAMQNELIWETASEINSDYFNLEKSSDGLYWKVIGTVKAKGTSYSTSTYNFSDRHESSETNYYRLSQIDLNGDNNFSKIVSIQSETNTELLIYPNPTEGNFTIELSPKHTFHSINILNASGKIINKIEIGDTFSINLQLPLQNGIYFIQAEGEGITTTYTMVKI